MNALEPILAATREAVKRRRDQALAPRDGEVRDFLAALKRPGISLIAEHKRQSPSAGVIRQGLSLEEVVAGYERGGAAALSVLTEGPNFGGSLDDLRRARAASTLPILRKDFVVDSFQVEESLSAGADAILLIVAALSAPELRALHDQARALGLAALVEVHDAAELEVALSLDSPLIGINNRNLSTLQVDTMTTFGLLDRVDGAAAVVAESGIHERSQLDELEAAGVDAVLIGEALMRSGDIEAAVRALTAPTM